jgi:hypothetical protein
VLLHAIEPARPIDMAPDAAALDPLVENVKDRAVEIMDLEDRGPAERPPVPRLAA